jgi:phospholipid transport system substrate-binding protein
MFLDKDGTWRIYNISAAGISLVTTYRSSYGQIIAAKGIDSLIDSINAKTRG